MAEPRLRRNVSNRQVLPTISINERPLFMQNGSRRFSTSVDAEEISNFRRALPQFLAVSVKNILLFAYGMTLGFPTIVIPSIQGGSSSSASSSSSSPSSSYPPNIILNRDEISWFSSINLICVPLGCIFSGLLTQPIGKRRAMQIVNLPMLASWLIFHFATKTEHLYAALCLSGLGGGLMEAPVLTYVAEITEPKYRGILSALGSTCVIAGVFVQFLMGSLTDWRTIAALSSAFPVISIVALCFVPESPTWLIREQRFREGIKALMWLRGWVPEYKIEAEFNRLYDELIVKPATEEEAENHGVKPSYLRSRIRLFRKRSFIVPFLIVAFAFFTGHFSGKTPLQTYAVQIFHTLKAPINKYHATILLGVAELVATIISVCLIHFTGKRPLVFISTIGVGLCVFGTATYAHYLKVVPGFAINNVVVNASSIVPKESIISQDNITQIFEKEEKAILLHAAELKYEAETELSINTETTFFPSTLQNLDEVVTTNWPITELPKDYKNMNKKNDNNSNSRVKRATNSSYNTFLLDSEGNQTNFSLDYDENAMNGATVYSIFDLFDSEEDNSTMATTLITETNSVGESIESITNLTSTAFPSTTTTTTPAQPAILDLDAPKRVVDEILIDVPKQEKSNFVWIPLVLLLGAAFFAHLGIRMIPWILIGEVFPAPVRSTASGWVSGLGYIFGFLANKLFLQMLTILTLPGTFWLYAAVAFTGAIVLYFTLPETEGRTLGEIEAHFSKKSDTNLLSKKWLRANEGLNNNIDGNDKTMATSPSSQSHQLQNLGNLETPIGPYTKARILQLQQSDFGPNSNRGGNVNPAFDTENNTTHL